MSFLPTLVAPHAWDATRLRPAFLCDRKFLYQVIYGLEKKGASNIDLLFGKAAHSAFEAYDLAKAERKKSRDPLKAALAVAWEESKSWPGENEPVYDSKKNRLSLMRLVTWYHFDLGANDTLTCVRLENEAPAIELAFALDIGNGVQLVSRPDQIVQFEPGEIWVRERKTTGSALGGFYDSRFSPDLQITIQAIAGSELIAENHRGEYAFRGVIVEAMQIGAGFVRFSRSLHRRSEGQIAEARAIIEAKIKQIVARVAKVKRAPPSANEPDWPMNEAACERCAYRELCAVDLAERPRVLELLYAVREPWNPTSRK